MTEAAYGFHFAWRPIATPFRSPWVLRWMMALLALGLLARLVKVRR